MYKEKIPSIKQSISSRKWSWLVIVLLLSHFISGCAAFQTTTQAPVDLARVFPGENFIPGWEVAQKVETYDREHLFNLVDGQADSFFIYGFEKVAVARYQNDARAVLNVEIWQLATYADAYGLFSASRTGSAVSIGNGGDTDPGRRLAFWQNRYFVSLSVDQLVADGAIHEFAKAIAGNLPTGGETPAIVNQLPPSGLDGDTSIFFHEEMSIQMKVWLGGENLLGLSQETNGVLGQYKLGNLPARLMLIEYPTSSQAAKALEALQSGHITGLVASDASGNLLGAVFGKLDAAQAQMLLQEALK
jgi:hypothetical protein